ncbi:MAG TPA: ABC transporter substrate-binding protein, partial [Azospirillaceae bacterium]|nr:ABC transporter substrate-binding protein [Azospirillaceae bacterium]
MLSLVYEGLTAISQDGRLVPALAERWETPDDGRTWRFFLRPGVRFHSGRPVTSADVRHSMEVLLRAKRPSISVQFLDKLQGREDFQSGRSMRLAGVVEIAPLTVEFRFEEAVAAFPYYPFFIVDGGATTEWGQSWHNAHSGGSGPFKLKSWRRGRDLTLTANQDYWGPKPAVENVSFTLAPGIDAALAMFDAGELDFVIAVEPAHRLIAADPRRRTTLQAVERMQARFLAMNADVYPPFADPRVRAAVSMALDRQAVIDGVYGGLAAAPRGFGVASFTGETNAGIVHKYDPDEGRRLLAQAGYPGGVGLPPIEFTVIDFSRIEGAYYADKLVKELGMPATLKVMERAAMISAANAGRLGLFIGGWTADFPDPLTYLEPIWHSGSPYNQARWRDAAYDAVVDKARRAADPAARAALYRD